MMWMSMYVLWKFVVLFCFPTPVLFHVDIDKMELGIQSFAFAGGSSSDTTTTTVQMSSSLPPCHTSCG